jgi:rhodanese-related sulfurtransferase
VIDEKLQMEFIPYGSDAFSAADFLQREDLLKPHLQRLMSVITARPREYVIFCGAVFEPLLASYIVKEHKFTLPRADGTPSQQACRFANLLIPHAGGKILAGLAQSWARQGLPMDAYAEEVRRLYNRR